MESDTYVRTRQLGEMLSDAFRLAFQNGWKTGLFMILGGVVVGILTYFLIILWQPADNSLFDRFAYFLFTLFLGHWVYGVVKGVAVMILIEADRGSKPGIKALFTLLKPKLPVLIGTALLNSALVTFAAIFFFFPSIFVSIQYKFFTEKVLLENKSYMNALQGSQELVEGYGGKVFGYIFGSGFVLYIVDLIMNINAAIDPSSLVASILSIVSPALWIFVFAPFLLFLEVLLYFDIRVRKEEYNSGKLTEEAAALYPPQQIG